MGILLVFHQSYQPVLDSLFWSALVAGVNKVGAEGDIFRRVIGYSLILTSAMGILAMIEGYVIPGIIPSP